jgi:uracil-DNA glycosylase
MSNIPNKLTPQEYASKMYEMLKPSGWHDILKGFLLSEDFVTIITTLEKCVDDGQRFTPPLKQVFNAFMQCPYDKTRVIMIGQDPYPQIGVADGIAFSCGNTKKAETSLRYILNAVNTTVYEGKKDVSTFDPDLRRWANQGVLLLNTALTTEINKIGKHIDMWHPFIAYLVDMLNTSHNDYVWVFMGKKAQHYEDLVDGILNNTLLLQCSHPASAAYAKAHHWDCNNIFNTVNQHLKEQRKLPEIVW